MTDDACIHLPDDLAPPARPPKGCETCLSKGKHDWVHLRYCQTCGHVGCCDNSPGKHATGHAAETSHPVIRSFEPGEDWFYCYIDDDAFFVDDAPTAASYTD